MQSDTRKRDTCKNTKLCMWKSVNAKKEIATLIMLLKINLAILVEAQTDFWWNFTRMSTEHQELHRLFRSISWRYVDGRPLSFFRNLCTVFSGRVLPWRFFDAAALGSANIFLTQWPCRSITRINKIIHNVTNQVQSTNASFKHCREKPTKNELPT